MHHEGFFIGIFASIVWLTVGCGEISENGARDVPNGLDGKPGACVDNDADTYCADDDCNDSEFSINPGVWEVEDDGIDNNCDGAVDEPPWNKVDNDGDGYSMEAGDCDDTNQYIGPDSVEDLGVDGKGDDVDNDCDGAIDEDDECECGEAVGNTVAALDCATEIGCHSRFVSEPGVMGSPTGDRTEEAFAAVARFGLTTNGLAPRSGGSYGLIATGIAAGTEHTYNLEDGGSKADPYSDEEGLMYDAVEYSIKLKAPLNATGFAFKYVFLSEEYDDYVSSSKNDKFYAILDAPITTDGEKQVINYTECRDPETYFDFDTSEGCDLPSGYCCYIAINTALSECCWFPRGSRNVDDSADLLACPNGGVTTSIAGTGFECASDHVHDGSENGSSTGWLETIWKIDPGEEFTLIFHLHDTDDGVWDSEIILDNFRWMTVPVDPGTSSIPI